MQEEMIPFRFAAFLKVAERRNRPDEIRRFLPSEFLQH
jgi:hypothetical protein